MPKLTLLALLLLLLAAPAAAYFCSSACIDYVGTCFNETTAGCMVCANNIFNINANWSSPTPCSLAPQRTIVANDLPNSPSMSLAGFTSSSPTPVTCSNYTFSGQYASADYLAKNYSGIALNHYAVVVRFNVGFVGAWSETDYLRLALTDINGATNFDFKYYCGSGSVYDNVTNITSSTDLAENINGEVGNATDCVRIKEYTLVHNTSYLALQFSALNSETNPAVAFWGIKELIVATKDCHGYCLTCFGGLNTQCLSCAAGYYLQGNVCLPVCDSNLYVVIDARLCVSQCPSRYFATTNGTLKVCANCQSGCALCSDSSTCLAWDGQEAYVPNLWKDKMEFWILLILVLCALIGYVIFRVVKKALPSDLEENMMTKSDDKDSGDKDKKEEVNDLRIENLPNDTMPLPNDSLSDSLGPSIDMKGGDTLWFNELVEMEPVEVKVRGRKRRGKGEDPLSVNTLDANSNVNL
jgi:hypothetical protein